MIFQDLSRRAIYSLISLLFIVVVLVFAYIPFVQWIVALLTAAVGSVGMWEFARMTKINKRKSYLFLLVGITAAVILIFYLSTLQVGFSLLPLLILFFGIISLFIYHFNKIAGATHSIALGFFSLFYIAVPMGLLLKILYLHSPCKIGHLGRYWFVYLIVVTKVTDIGAYFWGRLLGNRKLAVHISPGKTVAGALAGFFSAILFSFLFYTFARFLPGFYITFSESIWLGALLGIFGQAGDLAESLLKRDADVKDSNRIPGLGGVLDMLDSLLFTIPIIYFFLYLC